MGVNYLFDSNIIIYYLNDVIPENYTTQIDSIIDYSFNISAITIVEVLGWNKLNSRNKELVGSFLNKATIFDINDKVIKNAVKIKQKVNIKTPDSIIAATALCNNLTLITRNDKDFQKINKLGLFNPFEG